MSASEAPTSGLMIGTANGGNDGVLMSLSPFTVLGTFPGLFSNAAGLSHLPGTAVFSMTGGHGDGGNLYHFLGSGTIVGPLPTGFNSVPGLAWIKVGGTDRLVGSAALTSATIGNCLISIDPFSGTATTNGAYGSNIDGVDAIAQHPVTGTLYASTGFAYDGSPGDVLTIDPVSGLGTDTFTDMVPLPPCVVGGMTIDLSGQAYISMGGGGVGCSAAGQIYTWDLATNAIAMVGDGATGSMTDIQALF